MRTTLAPSTVSLSIHLHCFSRRDRRQWVAGCPRLDVYSQGTTETAARAALKEAIDLWFESCIARGTLDAALREVGFRPQPGGEPVATEAERVTVRQKPRTATPEGRQFRVEREIPAFIAAQLSSPETAARVR